MLKPEYLNQRTWKPPPELDDENRYLIDRFENPVRVRRNRETILSEKEYNHIKPQMCACETVLILNEEPFIKQK